MLEYRVFDTGWGFCAVVGGASGLRSCFLPHRSRGFIERRVERAFPEAKPNVGLLPGPVRAVQAYFEGQRATFEVRLDLEGLSEFRRRVLRACRRIPRGRTATYADLARAAGSPQAARAVGSTMANNPLPLIVPCHRVVRSDGSLGEFSSPEGPRLKRRLLQLEA
jgi:O-6-methylguanine DNA methyltransferase